MPGANDSQLTRAMVADRISRDDPRWASAAASVDLQGGMRWKPDLVATGPESALHVQLTDQLPRHWRIRLEAAADLGTRIHVAIPVSALWDLDTLRCLSVTDAELHIFGGDGSPQPPGDLLNVLQTVDIRLQPELRESVARVAWERCSGATTSNEKGHRLESLLSFLLGQSQELKVVECRLRTETEEIDIVAQPRIAGLSRCWAIVGSTFLLVEAKNWSSPVDKPCVSDMLTKLRGYRGTVKVGVLVGASGFTRDAKNHELRYASEEGTIVFVGPEEIEEWIAAEDLDEYFESLVRKAMLR